VKVGAHDFDGFCAPKIGQASPWTTFSVGIFEWVAKRNGKGLKRGRVKVRVIGPTSHPDIVKLKAAEIVLELDAGTYTGPKSIVVRRPCDIQ
jgi:hypothetical protein